MAVSMSAMVRSYPLEYGYELNEFDPFYNFRATITDGLHTKIGMMIEYGILQGATFLTLHRKCSILRQQDFTKYLEVI